MAWMLWGYSFVWNEEKERERKEIAARVKMMREEGTWRKGSKAL